MDRLVVVKFHTNIANRWLLSYKEKYRLSFSIHKVILTCLGGPFFPDTVYISTGVLCAVCYILSAVIMHRRYTGRRLSIVSEVSGGLQCIELASIRTVSLRRVSPFVCH